MSVAKKEHLLNLKSYDINILCREIFTYTTGLKSSGALYRH